MKTSRSLKNDAEKEFFSLDPHMALSQPELFIGVILFPLLFPVSFSEILMENLDGLHRVDISKTVTLDKSITHHITTYVTTGLPPAS